MTLPALRIGALQPRLPIIQGGMGVGISLSGLAAAVAEAGGIGVIAAAVIGFEEQDFKSDFVAANTRAMARHIRLAREKTSGVIGVNAMTAISNYKEIVTVSVDEGADIIFSGAGLPTALPKYVPAEGGPKLAPIVSSGRAAAFLCKNWKVKHKRLPDAFVVEGPKAGGHLGFKPEQIEDQNFRLETLVCDVIEAVKPYVEMAGRPIPVIAAGGIWSGADIHAMLKLGADGVQMGTRFVATHECDASDDFKQAYIDATEEDMVIVKSPVGMPGRALRNAFIESVDQGKRHPLNCPYHCLKGCDHEQSPYCIARALINARHGKMNHALAFAGANVHRVKEIVSVQELMDTLVREYEQCEKGNRAVNLTAKDVESQNISKPHYKLKSTQAMAINS